MILQAAAQKVAATCKEAPDPAMAEIVITEFMDQSAVDQLSAQFATRYDPELADRQEDISALLGSATALIVRNRTQVTKDLLAKAPALKCVGRLGVGLDNIDMDACKGAGVSVYPATGANNLSVAEYVISNAMVLLRGAYHARDAMLRGEWPRQTLIGRELSGRVMGLVGFGAIAREVAERARALGMDVIAYDPFCPADDAAWQLGRKVSFEDLLRLSDVVSLHVPLNDSTYHLIDAAALAGMKDGAILINAARGGVIDEEALASALSHGRLAGAALDVFEVEPLTANAAMKFSGIANLVLTPHIAGVTEESNVRVSALIAQIVAEHLTR